MKTKIIAVCVSFAAILMLSVALFVVSGQGRNAAVRPESAAAASVADGDDRIQMYAQFCADNLRASDTVRLTDLTHDGQDELLVLRIPSAGQWSDAQEENFLRVFTVSDGAVRMIYENQIMPNRDGWFLMQDGGADSLVHEVQAVWTGTGEITCKEFYLTEDGEPVSVCSLAQSFRFDDTDPEGKLADYESRVAQRYGSGFDGVRVLASTQRTFGER
ncbi:MAG: hypothetical protein IJT44_09870 [Clostridia bacterium]|nr:hypothetical protein [Clostridia bacterium]